MSLMRWEPFRDLVSLREAMDRLFEESFVRPGRLIPFVGAEALAVDVFETDDEVVVKTAVPGIAPEDLDITITGDAVTIKGETKREKDEERRNYIRRERHYGAFSRTVSLPGGLQTDQAAAVFEQGVLTLTIPKAEELKPRAIKVKAK